MIRNQLRSDTAQKESNSDPYMQGNLVQILKS